MTTDKRITTVAELIQTLQNFAPDTEIGIFDGADGWGHISTIIESTCEGTATITLAV